jgi:hypothetical protein
VRAVVVRCPNCGANLTSEGTVTTVTCSYCGTISRLQARTRVFQIPVHVPAEPGVPIARQRYSWLGMLPLVFIGLVIVSSIVLSMRAGRVAGDLTDRMYWAGGVPAMFDVDGDGVLDPIGLVRYHHAGDRTNLVAHSGQTGARLWQSEPLGSYGQLGQRMLGVAGDRVVIAFDRGTLTAYDARTGKLAWTQALGEKPETLCAGERDGELVVAIAGGSWEVFDREGQRREGKPLVRFDRARTQDGIRAMFERAGDDPADAPCIPLGDLSRRSAAGTLVLESWRELADIPGMKVNRLVRQLGGPELAVGYKSPGTSVPMIAALAGDTAVWVAEVPAIEPLVSRVDDHLVAVSHEHAAALYQPPRPGAPRVTAFDLARGTRLWDVELTIGRTFNPSSIGIVGDTVWVADSSGLRAHRIGDGSERLFIGQR